jgi:DNA polymerase-3 subunit alpha
MVDGFFLQIKGNIEEKFRQKDNWDLRIAAMALLTELRDKFAKSLTVCLDINNLDSQLLENLQQMININNEKYPVKNCTLRFKITDRGEAMLVDLPSKTVKVNPSDELMADIFTLTSVQPILN